MLDVYKFDLGKLNLLKKEVLISDLLANVITDTKSMVEEKNISIIIENNAKPGNTIYCDEKG